MVRSNIKVLCELCLFPPPVQLADQWDNLHRRYSKRLSSRRQSNAKARSSGVNSAHSLGRGVKSGSFTASVPSSGNSTPSLPDVSLPSSRLDNIETTESPQFDDSFDEEESTDVTIVPSYISLERKVTLNPNKFELSESDMIDPEILVPRKKSVPEPPFKPAHFHGDALPKLVEAPPLSVSSSAAVEMPRVEDPHYDNYKPRVLGSTPPGSGSKVMEAIVFLSSPTHEYDSCTLKDGDKSGDKDGDKSGDKGGETTSSKTVDISARYETAYPHHMVTVPQETTTHPDSNHEYANLEFGKPGINLPPILQAALSIKGVSHTKSSPTAGKKPMPIQRKRNQSDEEEKDLPASSVRAKSPSSNRSNAINPKKPVPPAKPLKLQSGSDDTITSSSSRSPAAKEGVVTAEVGGVGSGLKVTREASVPILVKTRPHSSSLAESIDQLSAEDELSVSLGATKPRSYTNVDQRPDLKKREPLLPHAPSSTPSSNLVVFGQINLSPDPEDSSGHAQSKKYPWLPCQPRHMTPNPLRDQGSAG